ncbi:MAG TPA: glycosyltransferase family 39 protein [Patescibacteria group bacterium]|nr:glycosyltransferase family 39 protein [Patescibacteria group bacterium]
MSDTRFEPQEMYEPPSPLAAHHRAFAWGIFTFALLVRAAYLKQLQTTPLWNDLPVDLGYYHDWAVRIAAGDWIGKDVFEQSPLYAYFLAIVFKLFGAGLLMPRLIQIVVGSLTCVLIYRTGRLVVSPVAGLVAGLMAAVYGPFLFYDGMLMKEVFSVFFMSAMVYQLHAGNASQRGMLATAGLCLGLAALVRDNMILLAAPIALWLMIDPWIRHDRTRSRRSWERIKEGIQRVASFAIGILLIVVPVAARNYHVSGELVPLTAGGGEVFYIGNNPDADGRYSPPLFVRASSVVEHEDFRREAARRLGHAVTRQEASSYWLHQGLDWIRDNPRDWLALLGRKLLIFWNHYELPDNHSYEHHRRLVPILQLPLVTFGWLVPMAAGGLVLTCSRWRDLMGIYLTGIGYVGTVMLFFNFGRFRMPVVPVLMVLAGAGVAAFFKAVTGRRLLPAALALAVACGVLLVNARDLEDDPVYIGQSHAQLAELLYRSGRTAEAAVESRESIRLLEGFFTRMGGATGQDGHGVPPAGQPGRPDLGASFYAVMEEAYQTRSRIARAEGSEAEAEAWARHASIAAGAESRAAGAAELARKGEQEMQAHRFQDAARSFSGAIDLVPASGAGADPAARVRLSLHLAEALHRSGRPREALSAVESAIERAPGLPDADLADAHYGEALIYRDLGDRDAMRAHLIECLRLNPSHPRADWMKQELSDSR